MSLPRLNRRLLIQSLLSAPLLAPAASALDPQDLQGFWLDSPERALSIFELRDVAENRIDPRAWAWMMTGVDDERTLQRNREIFDHLQLRLRRLINVSEVDTSVELFGQTYPSPIMLSPVGVQSLFHPEAELATARATGSSGHLMMAGTMTSASFDDIASHTAHPPFLQLYTRWERAWVRDFVQRCEARGCPAVALTVDTPAGGWREPGLRQVSVMLNSGTARFGNFPETMNPLAAPNAALDWDYVDWLKGFMRAKLMIKGIVTAEDARLAIEHGVDGIFVSNHGGRQGPSGRSALESLAEVLAEVDGEVPVIVDGGFRRGTDIFKALALGADMVAIGRPQVWGLGAFGEAGVGAVLNLVQADLERVMRFAGTTSLTQITRDHLAAPEGSAFSHLGLRP